MTGWAGYRAVSGTFFIIALSKGKQDLSDSFADLLLLFDLFNAIA